MKNESVVRVDGSVKADGSLAYCNDLEFDGLHGEIIRSSIAYGDIVAITYDEAFDFSEYVIVDYQDIEGVNTNTILFDDQPFLAQKRVRFIGEPILLIAHKSKQSLKEVKKHITIEYNELEAVYTLEEAKNKKNIIFSDDNVYKTINVSQGALPDTTQLQTLTKVYTTPHQEQLYLEPQSMIARYNNGNIKIIGSMQCPFYVESSLENLTNKKIEVQQAPTGGGFGGKEDYPSLMAAYVYLLSKKSSQDVKMVLSRSDDIAYTPKRHPTQLRYKSFFDTKGKLYALEVEAALDGGAYATLTPVVQARLVLHCAGFYDCPYIKVASKSYATNTPPNGAFRGFGAPQALFGIERHMDDIARYLGLSPAEVRAINLPTQNSLSVTGAKISEYKRLRDIFETAREKSRFDFKHAEKKPYSGIGLSLFMHGGGFIGNGEIDLDSEVWLELQKDGVVEIKVSSVEMGQGAQTALSQMVAEALEIPLNFVRYHTPNTQEVPDSGPTVSSRTVMIVGALLQEAATKLKKALGRYATSEQYQQNIKMYLQTNNEQRFRAKYKKPSNRVWDEDKFYGNGYDGYSLGCYVAQVHIDPITYQVYVDNFYAYNDVGKVVNLTMAEGQVQGGVAQGLGYALFERVVYEKGRVKNNRLSDYIIPMAADMPKMQIGFLDTDAPPKGLGELPIDGVAPAVVNAVTDALDIAFDSLPILPETVEQQWR